MFDVKNRIMCVSDLHTRRCAWWCALYIYVCMPVCPAFMNEIDNRRRGGGAEHIWWAHHIDRRLSAGQIFTTNQQPWRTNFTTHSLSIAQQFRGQTTTHSIWRKSEDKLYYISLLLYSSKVLVVVVFVSMFV
jgi:hypothetical protein